MPPGLTESDVEEIVLFWFGDLGYEILHGPGIGPGESGAERSDYADPLLPDRLRLPIFIRPAEPPA